MAKDVEVKSGTSSTTRSTKNLPLNMAEDGEIGSNGNCVDNEKVKTSPLSKKPNVLTRYFTFLRSKKRWVYLDSF